MTDRQQSASLDNIARFYENVASAVEDNGGIFMHDNFSTFEKKTIVRTLQALTRKYRDEADQERVKECP